MKTLENVLTINLVSKIIIQAAVWLIRLLIPSSNLSFLLIGLIGLILSQFADKYTRMAIFLAGFGLCVWVFTLYAKFGGFDIGNRLNLTVLFISAVAYGIIPLIGIRIMEIKDEIAS